MFCDEFNRSVLVFFLFFFYICWCAEKGWMFSSDLASSPLPGWSGWVLRWEEELSSQVFRHRSPHFLPAPSPSSQHPKVSRSNSWAPGKQLERFNRWKLVRQQTPKKEQYFLSYFNSVTWRSSLCGLWMLCWALRRGLWSGASSKVRERMTVSQRNWAPLISSSRSSSWVTGSSSSLCGLSFTPGQNTTNVKRAFLQHRRWSKSKLF